ncbi:Phage Tail Collar Domain [Pantoea sesami]|nr:Phage Tail Collar Domain [Pantoea sesami]
MYWLDNNSGQKDMPEIPGINSPDIQWFHEGGAGRAPSYPGAHFFNMLQAELLGVADSAGIEPDKFKLNQLSQAIKKLIKDATDPWVQYAFPEWQKAYTPYIRGTVVKYGSTYWVSLSDDNKAIPGKDNTKWQEYLFERATIDDVDEGRDHNLIITPPVLKQATDALLNTIAPLMVPVGAAMLWYTPVPPDGWLEGNGQAFDPAENPKLLSVFPSGRVPDCRGYLIRGWDHGAGVDPDSDRQVGSIQQDAMQQITGTFPADTREAQVAGSYTTGVFTERRISKGSGSDGTNRGRLYTFDSARQTRTASETRGKNIATMVIFKTDKAVAEAGEAVPTAIIVSPETLNIESGKTQQFSATVLPSSVSGQYPVSWSVSDKTLGSISQNGLYTSSGLTGKQTIIASISTGLYGRAEVSQYEYVKNITISPVPVLKAGETYSPALTIVPATANEPLIYASSDNDIATFFNGQVSAAGQGQARVSVTGMFSGITAHQTVSVTAAEQPHTGGGLIDVKIIDSSGTYTPSPQAKKLIFEAVGAGGGIPLIPPLADDTHSILVSGAGAGAYMKVMTRHIEPYTILIGVTDAAGSGGATYVYRTANPSLMTAAASGGKNGMQLKLARAEQARLSGGTGGHENILALEKDNTVLAELAGGMGQEAYVLASGIKGNYGIHCNGGSSALGRGGDVQFAIEQKPKSGGGAAGRLIEYRHNGSAFKAGGNGRVIVWEYAE